MTVEETLEHWPDIYKVFMNYKTGCVGCFLQQFCTLRDVASIYRIPLPELIEELTKHVQKNQQLHKEYL
jgi:hybrid cluster-associated redox disulfide protein